MQIAYHASHEQFAPSRLLQLVQQAQAAGFHAIHSSDHFHPWSERQGQSGFSFGWLGAAMAVTTLPFSMVCAPGQRYHPAIVAQAIATLAEMFPQRFSVELGSGEALNEKITGQGWPDKAIRNERLLQCFHIINTMLQGKEVSFHGHVCVSEARLYTLPPVKPPLFCAAMTADTATWAATWAQGLLTTGGNMQEVQAKITAFRNAGGHNKPVYVQHAFSFANTVQAALQGAHEQWRSNLIPKEQLDSFWLPLQFDIASANITPQQVAQQLDIYTDIQALQQKIMEYKALGIQSLILHNVNTDQETFISQAATILS
jgi:probable non-F420 flavinoid oxidoreductase